MFSFLFSSEPSYDAEFQHFLRGKEIVLTGTAVPQVKGLCSEQSEAMVRLSFLPAFKDLVAKVQADEVIVHLSSLLSHKYCLTKTIDETNNAFLYCSSSSCGWKVTLQSCLYPTCGRKRRRPVSFLAFSHTSSSESFHR